jgi:DNA-binding NtrC family response regulator
MQKYPAFSVMLVDDELPWLRSLSLALKRVAGITNTILVQDSREVMSTIDTHDVGLILLDLTMPHVSGESILKMLAEHHPEIAVIVVTGMNQIETAVACMSLGAFDYYVKTTEEDRLISGIVRGVKMVELQRENRAVSKLIMSNQLTHPEAFADIITENKTMLSIFQYLESVVKSMQPILITGESGVGKELIARAVHTLGGGKGPLVCINVAGLDDNVFADTLFGHVDGAFTGASGRRAGMIEEAAGGTLLLDEIGDLSIPSQVKLLRLLQEGEYFPLGSDKAKRSSARIVCTTLHDLSKKIETGQFRRDLYFRLCTHHVHIPALRERREDIPLLLNHYLDEASKKMGKKRPALPEHVLSMLTTFDYPGNIRQLRAMVYDAVSMCSSETLTTSHFMHALGSAAVLTPETTKIAGWDRLFTDIEILPTFDQALELLVAEALRRSGGNQTAAAKLLGVSQPALSKRLKLLRENASNGLWNS